MENGWIQKEQGYSVGYRVNPWMLSTFVLIGVCIVLSVLYIKAGVTGNVIADTPTVKTPTVQNAPTAQTQQVQQPIPKTDKPSADFYVFSYCPYGTQIEKGLVPVYNLLKSKADINIVFIGAMHGIHEEIESYRQLCIRKLYGNDKLFAYLEKFNAEAKISACNKNMNCSDPIVEGIMNTLGINVANVNSCMPSDGKAMYQADVAKAAQLKIGGSPTVMLNGVKTTPDRSSAGLLTSICSAFTNKPSECSQTLSTAKPSSGFGSGTTTGSTTASC